MGKIKYSTANIERILEKADNDAITVDSALSTESENPVQNKVITEELKKKVDKVSGKGLSTNDYTDKDKEKTLILGPHIGDDTEEHKANLLIAVDSNACYGRFTVLGCSGTYLSVGRLGNRYYVDVLSHRWGDHYYPPYLERYVVYDGMWTLAYSISIEEILTSSNLATQSEIDALFDNGTSGGGSTSY